MIRIKNFDATGIAPNGVLFAGDLNALQDAVAALTDLTQNLSVATLAIGESGLQLIRYGTSEARLVGAFRADGIIRALGGLFAGSFTTTARDAIPAGFRPYGLVILNQTTNQYEWNSNTDPSPVWRPLGVDPAGVLAFTGAASGITFLAESVGTNNIIVAGVGNEVNPRFAIRADGRIEWGAGGASPRETFVDRLAANMLQVIGGLTVRNNLVLEAGQGGTLVFADGTVLATAPLTYTSQALRDGLMYTEGVLSPAATSSPTPQNSLIVSAGTGWNLVINPGAGLVQGDDDTWQGAYLHLQRAAVNLLLNPTNPATNPRVDAIGIQFNDPSYSGRTPVTGGIAGNIVQVAGTPTSGATTVNLNGGPGKAGGPAFPNSFLLLAYYVANPGDSGTVSGQIVDQRFAAGPAVWGEDNHRYRIGVDNTGTLGTELVL